MPETPAILDAMRRNLDGILKNITGSQLSRYDRLQKDLHCCDVASDEVYQRTFSGFYRVHRRSKEWRQFFFGLLQSAKSNQTIGFLEVLDGVFAGTGRVEPSFCSKLVATIRPSQPVYDSQVREHLALEIPRQHEPASVRIKKFGVMYADLEKKVSKLTQDAVFVSALKPAFDQSFAEFIHFTDTKKLDLLLWQFRQKVDGGA